MLRVEPLTMSKSTLQCPIMGKIKSPRKTCHCNFCVRDLSPHNYVRGLIPHKTYKRIDFFS